MAILHHSSITILSRHCKTIDQLSKLHSHLIVTGRIESHHLAIATIHNYLSFGLLEHALSIYHSTHKPTLPFQNSVIRCLSNHGHHPDILSLYYNLQNSGSHRSDNYTFPFVIKACAGVIRTGKEVHCKVLRSGYAANLVVGTALVDMYAKNGQMKWSKRVFDEIPDRDVVSWNALISGFASNGCDVEAFTEFGVMRAGANGVKPNASTFVSLVPMVGPKLGRSLHGFALKLGVFGDENLMPGLVMMYAGIEDLGAARRLFDAMECRDLVSWNAMISAYSQNGRADKAVEVFWLLCREGVRPNFVTMLCVLQSCGDLTSTCCGGLVHAIGIKLGLVDRVSVVTSLVTMYGKLGEIDAAKFLFEGSMERNVLLYNSMFSAYLLNGIPDMGLATFHDMLLEGLLPDAVSIINVISGCSMADHLEDGKCAHGYVLKRGFDSNTNAMNTLLALYSDFDQFDDTLKLFSTIRARNVVSWNTLISGWTKIGDTMASVSSFCQMRREKVQFDLITMISMLPNFHNPEDLYNGMSFHSLVIKFGFESDISLKNVLITMYTNCGHLEAGCLLFEGLTFERTIVSWNALLTGYRRCGLLRDVMKVFDRMSRHGQKPNSVTLLNLLPSCETELDGKSIHGFAIRNFSELESSLLSATMCMYDRFEDFTSCFLLFETMDKQNVVSWNTLMSIYACSSDAGAAVTSFKEMLEIGLKPDIVTMLVLISACSRLGSLVLAQCLTSFAIRKGFQKNTALINASIYTYAKCGSLTFAREIFDGLELKDSITWSVMITAYGMHGEGEVAVSLFSKMQEEGVGADDITFVSVLSACSHSGLVKEGLHVFESMAKVHRVEPRLKHFACIVDLLGRSGHLDEAYDMIRRLSPSDRVCASGMLESLLGACRSYGNVEVGEAIGELVLELNPGSAGTHVMLSNIYAGTERWSHSGRLRFDMDARGLKKEPGLSLIEVK